MYDVGLVGGDLSVVNGQLVLINKSQKLQQQLLKLIITSVGNYLHPQYGSEIMDLMGSAFSIPSIKASIRDAMDYFISLQSSLITFGLLDPEEILYKIAYINVSPLNNDPRGAMVDIGYLDGTNSGVINITQSVTA